MRKLVLAARGSRLSRIQADSVKNLLAEKGVSVTILEVCTRGDRDETSPLVQIGGQGLFVSEIERCLLEGKADIAVHSGKDLPYRLKDGLIAAGVPKAADPRDCLLFRKGESWKSDGVIGTGSPRRVVECKKFYPDARYESIRGNVDTRLEKLKNGLYDGILLAKAGLDRLQADLSDFQVRIFEPSECIPSACQGILCAECRQCDTEIRDLLREISDPPSFRRFEAERYMLNLMRADCTVPLGVYSELLGEDIKITAMLDGKKSTQRGPFAQYPFLCEKIRDELYG